MGSFHYVIKDEIGIHARPAGMLAKMAKGFDSAVTITKGEKTVDASKLMAVMGLGVKKAMRSSFPQTIQRIWKYSKSSLKRTCK